jgi:hypothetical protein
MSGGIVFGGGMAEEWRPVVGYEGLYEVSDTGGVRSVKSGDVRYLSQFSSNGGYPCVMLVNRKARKCARVHLLVMGAFVGPRPQGMMCRHLNGDPRDARLVNLKYGTQSENEMDKRLHGTDNRGERHPLARLSERDVLDIRYSGKPVRELAAAYGVSLSHVYNVRSGQFWGVLR